MMRYRFADGNVIAIKGNTHFTGNVTRLLMPIFEAYWKVGDLNSEPHDQKRMDVEIQMAGEAQAKNEPYQGKYVSFVPEPSGDICSRCAETAGEPQACQTTA